VTFAQRWIPGPLPEGLCGMIADDGSRDVGDDSRAHKRVSITSQDEVVDDEIAAGSPGSPHGATKRMAPAPDLPTDERSCIQELTGVAVRIKDPTGELSHMLANMPPIASYATETRGERYSALIPQGEIQRLQDAVVGKVPKPKLEVRGLDGDAPGENTAMLKAALERHFATVYDAFAFCDANGGSTIGWKEIKESVEKLASEKGEEELGERFDVKSFLAEFFSGIHGQAISASHFVTAFRFGDDVSNWKEKLVAARERLSVERKSKERRESTAAARRELGKKIVDRVKEMLARKFQNVAEAFVFFDQNSRDRLSESDISLGLRRLKMGTVDTKLLMTSADHVVVDGFLDEYEFRRSFAWHPCGDSRAWDRTMKDAKVRRLEIIDRVLGLNPLKQRSRGRVGMEVSSVSAATDTSGADPTADLGQSTKSTSFSSSLGATSSLFLGVSAVPSRAKLSARELEQQWRAERRKEKRREYKERVAKGQRWLDGFRKVRQFSISRLIPSSTPENLIGRIASASRLPTSPYLTPPCVAGHRGGN